MVPFMTDNSRVSHSSELRLRVLIFQEQEDGNWVAQVLEKNIAAHGPTPYSALAAVQLSLQAHAVFDTRHQRVPFSRLKPAPAVYFDAFKRATPLPPPSGKPTPEPMQPALIDAAMSSERIAAA